MTALVHCGPRSFPNNSAISGNLRVKLSGGYLVAAGAADDEIGILEDRTFSTDPKGSVRMPATHETVRVTASEAIAQYANVYPAADGKVSATDNGPRWGIALEAASGDGSQIEVLRLPEPVGGSGLLSETVTFTEDGDTTYTGTVSIPAGATLVDIIIDAVSLWDDGTSAVLKVGDETDDDGFFTGVNLKATDLLAEQSINFDRTGGKEGAYLAGTATHWTDRYRATARTVTGVVTTGGQDGSAGVTRMLVIYALPANVKAATGA